MTQDDKHRARLELAPGIAETPTPTQPSLQGVADVKRRGRQNQKSRKHKESKGDFRHPQPKSASDDDDNANDDHDDSSDDFELQPGAYSVPGSTGTASNQSLALQSNRSRPSSTTPSSVLSNNDLEASFRNRIPSTSPLLEAELAQDPAEALEEEERRKEEAIAEAIRKHEESQQKNMVQAKIVPDSDNKFCGGRLSKLQFSLLICFAILLVAGVAGGVAAAFIGPKPPTPPPTSPPTDDEETALDDLVTAFFGGQATSKSSSNGLRLVISGRKRNVADPNCGWYEIDSNDGKLTPLFTPSDWERYFEEIMTNGGFNEVSYLWCTMSRDGSTFVVVAHDDSELPFSSAGQMRFYGLSDDDDNSKKKAFEKHEPLYLEGLNRYGASIDLSTDGDVVAAGSAIDTTGRVTVYSVNNNQWQAVGNPIEETVPYGIFGEIVRLSINGTKIAVSDGHRVQVYEYPAPEATVAVDDNIQNWTLTGSEDDMVFRWTISELSLSEDGSSVTIIGSGGQESYSYNPGQTQWIATPDYQIPAPPIAAPVTAPVVHLIPPPIPPPFAAPSINSIIASLPPISAPIIEAPIAAPIVYPVYPPAQAPSSFPVSLSPTLHSIDIEVPTSVENVENVIVETLPPTLGPSNEDLVADFLRDQSGAFSVLSSDGRRLSFSGWEGSIEDPNCGWYEIGDEGDFTPLFSENDWDKYYGVMAYTYEESYFWCTMSSDGNTFVVVAQNFTTPFSSSEMRFFGLSEETFEKDEPLYLEGLNWYGASVDLSADGSMVAAGSLINTTGKVAVYNSTNSNEYAWEVVGSAIEESLPYGIFGEIVRLSANGTRLAVSDGNTVQVYEYLAVSNNNQNWTLLGSQDDLVFIWTISELSLSEDGSSVTIIGAGGEESFSYYPSQNRWLPFIAEPPEPVYLSGCISRSMVVFEVAIIFILHLVCP